MQVNNTLPKKRNLGFLLDSGWQKLVTRISDTTILVRDSVWREMVHRNQEVSIPPLELCPNAILVHQTPVPCSGTSGCYAGVTFFCTTSQEFLEYGQLYRCLTLSRVFFKPSVLRRSPCSSVNISFTLLWGTTMWAAFVLPSSDPYWRSCTPSLISREFHWVQ
jgi:hypothetical protein